MQEQLEQRLQDLKAELESGQKVLSDLGEKQADIRETLLRISGAIQVLEEDFAKAGESSSNSEALAKLVFGHPERRAGSRFFSRCAPSE